MCMERMAYVIIPRVRRPRHGNSIGSDTRSLKHLAMMGKNVTDAVV